MNNEYYAGQMSIMNALDDYIEEAWSHGDGINADTLVADFWDYLEERDI